MAELIFFGYTPGTSLVHGLDSRFKLIYIFLVSLASLKAGLGGFFLSIAGIILLMIHTRVSLLSVFKAIRYFLLLLVFVFVARSLSTPGTTVIHADFFISVTFTDQGMYDGAIICLRLLMMVLMGLLFVSTTRSSEIRAAGEWLLAPIPFIPEKRVAVMMGLMIRFIPVILNQATEIISAQRARGIENRKNPIYRLTRVAIPLVRRTFQNADELVLAMEARCYSENRTDPEFSSGPRDWKGLFIVLCFCVLMVGIDFQ